MSDTMRTEAVRDLVDEYVTAVNDGDFDRLARLVHPDATFGGTVRQETVGVAAFVQGFANLRPITRRTDVHEIVVDGDRAAVLYDLVTDTAAGSVLCAEFLSFDDSLIRTSTLLFDWRRWPEALGDLQARVAAAAGPEVA